MIVHPYFYAFVLNNNGALKVLENKKYRHASKIVEVKRKYSPDFVEFIVHYFGGMNQFERSPHNVLIKSIIDIYYLYCGYTVTAAARKQRCNHATVINRIQGLYNKKDKLPARANAFFRDYPELLIQLKIYITKNMKPIRKKEIEEIRAKLDAERDALVELCNKKGNAIAVNDYFYDEKAHTWYFITQDGQNHRSDKLFLPE